MSACKRCGTETNNLPTKNGNTFCCRHHRRMTEQEERTSHRKQRRYADRLLAAGFTGRGLAYVSDEDGGQP